MWLSSRPQGIQPGERIPLSVAGQQTQLTVAGFVRTKGLPAALLTGQARAYMTQPTFEQFFHVNGVNLFLVRVQQRAQTTQTFQQLIPILQGQHVELQNSSLGQQLTTNTTGTNNLFVIISVVSAIALLLSAFLLISTITTVITEQFPIIGTMKAVGATRGQVMANYLFLVGIYAIVGTGIGMLLGGVGGYFLLNYISGLLNLDNGPFTLDPLSILLSCAVGLGVPLLAAIIPVYRGTSLTVRETMASYGLESQRSARNGSGLLARGSRIFSQTIQFGLRSLFRKRVRLVLTLLALSFSALAFLTVQTTTNSLAAMLNQIGDTYHYDVIVTEVHPVSYQQVQTALSPLKDVQRVEPFFQSRVDTQWGHVVLTAVQPETQLYQKKLLAGHWLTDTHTQQLVLSNNVAKQSGLHVGSVLHFHNDVHTAQWTVVGILMDNNLVNQNSLGTIFAPVQQVDQFQQLPADSTSGLIVAAHSHSSTAVNALASQVDSTLSSANLPGATRTESQQIQRDASEFQVLYGLLNIATIIIAIVGAMSLFNSLAMSVMERRREIGILRSVGASSARVALVFWTEGNALGLLSWLVALLLGIPISWIFVQLLGLLLTPIPFAFNPFNLLLMLVFILAITALVSLGPARSATKMRIAEILRYE
ncbi:FtsX-like permease family protein [Dictyobacter kobayashii]|uniref:ABC3 transporter permease C-terminal domain-containing protein n=1 Tax=Dictyobacter kobayashii TaxID=2014872 RepID=A0A402AVJ4_9CHLR|nr:FtsX-like permease family protein [Dictyobacter kobayashii]GCE23089.1 hypothetical protein KDK_68890 [Dictyobacter kobayashii]